MQQKHMKSDPNVNNTITSAGEQSDKRQEKRES